MIVLFLLLVVFVVFLLWPRSDPSEHGETQEPGETNQKVNWDEAYDYVARVEENDRRHAERHQQRMNEARERLYENGED